MNMWTRCLLCKLQIQTHTHAHTHAISCDKYQHQHYIKLYIEMYCVESILKSKNQMEKIENRMEEGMVVMSMF